MRIVVLVVALASTSPTSAHAGATPSGGAAQAGGGISVEEYQRVFPPAPVAVRAEMRAGVATVTWSPPPAVAPTRAYDPTVGSYRVYRIGAGGSAVLIGETVETAFRDPRAPGGTTQRYAVTAVQRSGQESGLSEAAEVRVP
jgi:hypothetical protein